MLPLLGLDFLRSPASEPVVATEAHATSRSVSPILEMTVKKFGITATAQEVEGEFIVFKGSQARLSTREAAEFTYMKLRTKIEEDWVIVPGSGGQTMVFSRNYILQARALPRRSWQEEAQTSVKRGVSKEAGQLSGNGKLKVSRLRWKNWIIPKTKRTHHLAARTTIKRVDELLFHGCGAHQKAL